MTRAAAAARAMLRLRAAGVAAGVGGGARAAAASRARGVSGGSTVAARAAAGALRGARTPPPPPPPPTTTTTMITTRTRAITTALLSAPAPGVGAAAAVQRSRQFASAAAGGQPLPVPTMGESITEGTIIGYMKAVGEVVEEDDIVAQIETDKITVDVRAPKAGVVTAIFAADGDVVKVGDPIATIDYSPEAVAIGRGARGDAAFAEETVPKPDDPANKVTPPQQQPQQSQQQQQPKKEDSRPAPEPIDIKPVRNMSESGERRVSMTRMRKRIAERLKEAQNTAAMLTTFNEIDMAALMDLRSEYKDAFEKKHGAKLGFMSAFVKASTVALLEQPEVNAFIDGGDIIYRDYVDVSVAVSTPKGLVVPAIRGCENMSFAAIEKTILALGERARKGELTIEEMQGGTFTISNGGVFGSLLSTPIINMPQSAILGMHIIQKRPIVIKDQIVIRPMMYVALSYDHRLIDGREAVTFLRRVKTLIEDPRRLLLEIDI